MRTLHGTAGLFRLAVFVSAFFLCGPFAAARARADESRASYVAALVARAHDAKLAADPQWIRLGHWRRTMFGGWKSEADGLDFFLAPDGPHDPSAELDATLAAIFGLSDLTPDQKERKVQPAFCRFPARMAWLNIKLDLDPSKLAVQPCPRFQEYWDQLQPESASLVFSSYYLNNPASAFGHTFLRLRKRSDWVPREKRELLDYGVDYAATTDTGNPILYAFKGLTGLFPGQFSRYPYYYKVREYNDYESRDLWEYDLGLTQDQVAMLALHIYELGSTFFYYYYLDENCSYHVLAALEVANPELHLLDHVKVPVVPADTVKALYANPGLVRDVRFRPSAQTQFAARVATLSGDERDRVQALADDPNAPLGALSPERQIAVLDAAADLVDIRFAKDLVHDPHGTGGQRKQRILERRATILRPSADLVVPPPTDKMPHVGHDSSRLGVGFGYTSADGAVYELSHRLALHDLADAADGYPELAQIEFLPTVLRLYPKERSVQLERLDVVNVLSLHEMNRFDHRLSWHVHGGLERYRDEGCPGCLVGEVGFGTGPTVTFAGERIALFAMSDLTFQASKGLDGIRGARAIRFGVGPSGGARVRLADRVTWLTTARWSWLPATDAKWTWSVESTVRAALTPNLALGVDGRKFAVGGEGLFSTFLYF